MMTTSLSSLSAFGGARSSCLLRRYIIQPSFRCLISKKGQEVTMTHMALHTSKAPSFLRQPGPCTTVRRTMAPKGSAVPQRAAAVSLAATRRDVLGATCAVLSLMAFQQPSLADSEIPRAYQELARNLINALEESIQADLNGAEEREVRRKADPAKNLVREFVQRWRDAPLVREEESHRLITDTVQQLGQFYQANGARARLGEELGNRLLQQLYAAEQALPPEEERKFFPF